MLLHVSRIWSNESTFNTIWRGSLSNIRRLTVTIKSILDLPQEVIFTDDCALMAHAEAGLQVILNRFFDASKHFRLTISLAKTEVLHQPTPNKKTSAPTIVITELQLANV